MNAALAAPVVSTPTLEPAAQAFADATSKPPFLFDLPPAEGRKAVDDVQSGAISKPDVDIEDIVVEGPVGGGSAVRSIGAPHGRGERGLRLFVRARTLR